MACPCSLHHRLYRIGLLAFNLLNLVDCSPGRATLTNIFQAGCCIGCPYRGKYCPACLESIWGTGSPDSLQKPEIRSSIFRAKRRCRGNHGNGDRHLPAVLDLEDKLDPGPGLPAYRSPPPSLHAHPM